MGNIRPRRNDAEFFFTLPSDLKGEVSRIAAELEISEAAFWRTAGRRLIRDLRAGRGRRIEFR